MNDVEPRHPEAMTMAAFVEGTLAPNEIAAVAEHLRDCSDCRTVVSETARFEREEAQLAPSHTTRWWLLAAAAVLAAIAISVPLLRWMAARNASPIAALIQAAPRQHRSVEARLYGFQWAPLQAPRRGEATSDTADMKLTGAAGEVLEKTAGQRQPESRYATGVAYLLINRKSDSIAALEQATKGSNDAHTWNDLAAARYTVATQDEHHSELPLALADADHALRLDPKSPEALFNRALILEHLGIRDQARKAWLAYLAVDSSSAWSVEARTHLHELEKTSRRFDPKMLDTIPADQLVREFPQEARTWGEGPMLAAWADAEAANDPSAPAKLARVHAIADALAAFTGERLLSDAVSAIERSSGIERAALVDGHRLYVEGKLTYSKHNLAAAITTFERATGKFLEGRSPMAALSAYYTASASLDANRGDEGQTTRGALLSGINLDRDRALAAHIQWSQALAANLSGNWGAAIRAAESSAEGFRRLGEVKNAAYLDSAAAIGFDLIGARDLAWARRIRSCSVLSEPQDHDRLCAILRSAATTLNSVEHPDAAIAMLDLAISELDRNPIQLALALSDKARIADRSGDTATAEIALTHARRAAASVTEAASRERVGVSIELAEAVLQSHKNAHLAIATLDHAIEFITKARLGQMLPDAYLQRARFLRAEGDPVAASAAYSSAMHEVESERSTIIGGDQKLRFLDTAAQIIDESIGLDLSKGLPTEALAIADRSRELSNVSSGPASPAANIDVPPATVVIEYVVLPHEIGIFCVSRGQITVDRLPIERGALAERIASFSGLIRSRAPLDQIKPESIALYKLLIAPIQRHLTGIGQIVLVPDRELHAIPFAALYDDSSGQYLPETFSIRFAPSASSLHTGTAKAGLQPALVIADPAAPGRPRLPMSAQEGERVAAAYGTRALIGAAATRNAVLESAEDSALIHYAGHADSDAIDSYGALLLAGDGNSGILDARDIESLALRNHPLVVLAACGSFRGDSTHAGGMSSLARAFLLAGARAVAGTMWEVDDDVAAVFFLQFHKHLRAGESPERALRAAQVEMIHASDPRLRHPATWTPVELLSNY